MIIEALLDLRPDGTWRLIQLGRPWDSDEPEPDFTEDIKQQEAAGPVTATEYLVNAHRVREHRRAEHVRQYPAHGHCSICGACGKKSTTHLRESDRHFLLTGETRHRGEPFRGEKC